MKNAIIIHGMPEKDEFYDPITHPLSQVHWLPWLREQLNAQSISAVTPEMPSPVEPEYEAWKKVFEQFPLSEETILVGHSCGGGFVIRYLSENNVKVGKVVLVAPWLDPEKTLDTDMFDFTIDPLIADRSSAITIFNSTDDGKEVHDSVAMIIEKIPSARIIEFKEYGHFCMEDMGTDAFPELLQEIMVDVVK